jgi:hypothetical protein
MSAEQRNQVADLIKIGVEAGMNDEAILNQLRTVGGPVHKSRGFTPSPTHLVGVIRSLLVAS